MTRPTTIVTDLDGTLVNTMDGVIALLWERFGVALAHEDCTGYDVAEAFWAHSDKIQETFRHCTAFSGYLARNIWDNGPFYQDLKPYWSWHQALQHAARHDIEVIMLTSRPPLPEITKATETWCEKWGYAELELVFSKSYEGGKLEALKGIVEERNHSPINVWFVDDDWSIVKQVIDRFPSSITAKMPDRPWTQPQFLLQTADSPFDCRLPKELA